MPSSKVGHLKSELNMTYILIKQLYGTLTVVLENNSKETIPHSLELRISGYGFN